MILFVIIVIAAVATLRTIMPDPDPETEAKFETEPPPFGPGSLINAWALWLFLRLIQSTIILVIAFCALLAVMMLYSAT